MFILYTNYNCSILDLNRAKSEYLNLYLSKYKNCLLQNHCFQRIILHIEGCTRSEMDIMTDFGSVVGGSSPSGCTLVRYKYAYKTN